MPVPFYHTDAINVFTLTKDREELALIVRALWSAVQEQQARIAVLVTHTTDAP